MDILKTGLCRAESASCHYPNATGRVLLWYHDHTLGINRLNVFAGLLGAFVVRDRIGGWTRACHVTSTKSHLSFSIAFSIWIRNSTILVSPDPDKPWTPEVFGDAILINGKIFPYLEVEPTKYRFRLLNGSNARFFHLSFVERSPLSIRSERIKDCSPLPLQLDRVFLAPGERADLIVDFEGLSGTSVILKNDILPVMQFRVGRNVVRNAAPLPQSSASGARRFGNVGRQGRAR